MQTSRTKKRPTVKRPQGIYYKNLKSPTVSDASESLLKTVN